MGCYRSYQTIKTGGFFNFAMKFLVAIFFAIVLFGCDGNECRNEYNNKAFSIIADNLKDKENRDWTCGSIDNYEYFINFYGPSNDDLETLLNNVAEAAQIPNVKITISVYERYWKWGSKTPPPFSKNILTVKLDTKSN